MEISYTYLRTKEVINTVDGHKLGKVSDVVFCYPENRVIGIVAPGPRCCFRRNEQFIEMKNIVKIGEDVILVNIGTACKGGKRQNACPNPPPPPPPPMHERRSYEEYE
jgi:YlmC/YmxH family sporulation protein